MDKTELKFTGERLIPKININQAFYYEHLVRYFFASQIAKKKTVLDLGCGTGYGSYILKNIGDAQKVIGIDISKDAIDYAKKYYGKSADFHIDNILSLKSISNNSIDIVTTFEVLEHTNKHDQMFKEIKRVLKDSGIIIISTPNILTYPPGNTYHLKELSPVKFENILKKYFKNTKIYFQNYFFSEEIRDNNFSKQIDILTAENLFQEDIKHFTIDKNVKDSEYLLAICSNINLPKFSKVSISTDKIDNFNLKNGILSLNQQFSKEIESNQQLLNKLEYMQKHITDLQNDLLKIQSSKTYKLWQIFNDIKKLFLKK